MFRKISSSLGLPGVNLDTGPDIVIYSVYEFGDKHESSLGRLAFCMLAGSRAMSYDIRVEVVRLIALASLSGLHIPDQNIVGASS